MQRPLAMDTPPLSGSCRATAVFVAVSAAASVLVLGALSIPGDQQVFSEDNSQGDGAAVDGEVDLKGASSAIQGILDFDPDVLNLRSGGKYVTVFLELPEAYSVLDVFVPSVKLNGAVYAETCFGKHISDIDKDGLQELMLKFSKPDVKATLSPGESVEVRVAGVLDDGTPFAASDFIVVTGP